MYIQLAREIHQGISGRTKLVDQSPKGDTQGRVSSGPFWLQDFISGQRHRLIYT
jgi:hypothetical protein